MEMRSTEEARANTEAFAKRLVSLLQDKKNIDEDIKSLKAEFKEEGVAVGIVTTAINQLKKDKKMTDSDRFEIDTIRGYLESNADIDNAIGELVAE